MNPTGQPMGVPAPPAPSSAAREAVNLPSIFLIVLGALGGLMFMLGTLNSITGGSERTLAQMEETVQRMPSDQQAAVRPFVETMAKMQRGGGAAFSLFCLALAGFVVFAGVQMRSLRNWGVALAGSLVAMIPCSTYCCCCLGIPIGIWALVVLTKPEVKSAFS